MTDVSKLDLKNKHSKHVETKCVLYINSVQLISSKDECN